MAQLDKSLRWQILQRDNFRCQYCGAVASEAELHVDHFVPKSLGGTNDRENLVTACAACNMGKRDKPIKTIPQRGRHFEPAVEFFWRHEADYRGPLDMARCVEADAHPASEYQRLWDAPQVLTFGASNRGFSFFEAAFQAAFIAGQIKEGDRETALAFLADIDRLVKRGLIGIAVYWAAYGAIAAKSNIEGYPFDQEAA